MMAVRTLFVLVCGMLLLPAYAEQEEDVALYGLLKRSNAVYSPHEAAEYGTVEQVQKAVAASPQHVNITDEQGDTPLHKAARRGNAEAVKLLLSAGADALAPDAEGRTPCDVAESATVRELMEAAAKVRAEELKLCECIKGGDALAVKRYLDAGVSANALSADKTQTVLCVAVAANQAECVRLLLEAGANVAYENTAFKSVLHVAAAHAGAEVIRILLEAGAEPMHEGNNGATPLHDAVWCRNSAAVEALIPAYSAVNFNPDGKRNGFPVVMAIGAGRADYVHLFIMAGMDVNDKRFADLPLLHLAAQHKHTFIVKMLLDAGADKNAKDKQGHTAADYATGEAKALLK